MNFSEWLKANGYDEEQLTPSMRKHLEAAWKADCPPANPAPEPSAPDRPATPSTFDETMAAIEAEDRRVSYIQERTAAMAREWIGHPQKIQQFKELAASAIADKKVDARAFDLSLLRLDRSVGPLILTPKERHLSGEAIEAAVCQAGGLKSIEKEFSPDALQQAHSRFRGGITLLEMIHTVATANGWRGGNVKRDLKGALRAAFDGFEPSAVGPSTLDISGILANIANKFVREQWLFVEDTYREISAKRPVSDFKEITTYSLTGDLTYEKLPAGGLIKHGTLGETSYSNKADTYAKILGIDRRDFINDDLNAFIQVNRRMGRGGALKVNDVFWTEFLDNSTFFTALRGNYDDGAGDTLMDLTGLANAHAMFMALNDPDGKPTGTMPRIVLTPPQLWPSAWTLIMSELLNLATSSAAATGNRSPWTGMFMLKQSRYLANSSFTGYSAKAWYMMADPNDLPVIEIAYLNGAEMPTIESADLDFDRLGVAVRGYHDFGVRKQEYRGGVKMKGEA